MKKESFSFDAQSRRQESTKKDCVGSMPLEFLLSKVTVKNFKTKTAKQKLLSNARFETLLIRLSLAFTELIGKLTGPILVRELQTMRSVGSSHGGKIKESVQTK